DKRKSYILRKIVLGNTLSNIGREMDISRQRVYELELKALDKLHGYHSPLIHRFDKFRGRAEFDSEVAMSRVRKIAKRTKRKWISKSLKTAGYKYKKYYRSAKEKVLREYHQKPENIGKRMLRDFKFVRARVESILKRVEKTEAHIKRYFF
ncbi:MAG: hypothetical protein QW112_00855, partial [Candidatus Micrarchaeia archaeon]